MVPGQIPGSGSEVSGEGLERGRSGRVSPASGRGSGGGGNGSADSKGLPSLSGGCQDYANCGASYTGEIQAGREGLGRGFCNRGTTTLRASVLATPCSHLDLVPLYAEQEDSPKSKPQLQS